MLLYATTNLRGKFCVCSRTTTMQQNNATSKQSSSTVLVEEQGGFSRLGWLSQSPNLDAIEQFCEKNSNDALQLEISARDTISMPRC